MITAIIILALLTVLVATEPEGQPADTSAEGIASRDCPLPAPLPLAARGFRPPVARDILHA